MMVYTTPLTAAPQILFTFLNAYFLCILRQRYVKCRAYAVRCGDMPFDLYERAGAVPTGSL